MGLIQKKAYSLDNFIRDLRRTPMEELKKYIDNQDEQILLNQLRTLPGTYKEIKQKLLQTGAEEPFIRHVLEKIYSGMNPIEPQKIELASKNLNLLAKEIKIYELQGKDLDAFWKEKLIPDAADYSNKKTGQILTLILQSLLKEGAVNPKNYWEYLSKFNLNDTEKRNITSILLKLGRDTNYQKEIEDFFEDWWGETISDDSVTKLNEKHILPKICALSEENLLSLLSEFSPKEKQAIQIIRKICEQKKLQKFEELLEFFKKFEGNKKINEEKLIDTLLKFEEAYETLIKGKKEEADIKKEEADIEENKKIYEKFLKILEKRSDKAIEDILALGRFKFTNEEKENVEKIKSWMPDVTFKDLTEYTKLIQKFNKAHDIFKDFRLKSKKEHTTLEDALKLKEGNYLHGNILPEIQKIKFPRSEGQITQAFLLPIEIQGLTKYIITSNVNDLPFISRENRGANQAIKKYNDTVKSGGQPWNRIYHVRNLAKVLKDHQDTVPIFKNLNRLNPQIDFTEDNTFIALGKGHKRTSEDDYRRSYESMAVDLVLFKYFKRKDTNELHPHVLLIKRADKAAGADWALPGGMVDPGKGHLYNQALREAREEAGVKPGLVEYKGELDAKSAMDRKDIDRKFTGTKAYIGYYHGGSKDIQQKDEAGEIRGSRWVPIEKLNEINFSFADHKDFIQEAANKYYNKNIDKSKMKKKDLLRLSSTLKKYARKLMIAYGPIVEIGDKLEIDLPTGPGVIEKVEGIVQEKADPLRHGPIVEYLTGPKKGEVKAIDDQRWDYRILEKTMPVDENLTIDKLQKILMTPLKQSGQPVLYDEDMSGPGQNEDILLFSEGDLGQISIGLNKDTGIPWINWDSGFEEDFRKENWDKWENLQETVKKVLPKTKFSVTEA